MELVSLLITQPFGMLRLSIKMLVLKTLGNCLVRPVGFGLSGGVSVGSCPPVAGGLLYVRGFVCASCTCNM